VIEELEDFTSALPGLRSYKSQCELYGLAHDYRKASFATATFHLKAVAVVQSSGKKRQDAIDSLVMAHRMLKRTVSALKSAGKEHKNLMSQLSPILSKADAVMHSALALKQSAA
jgi:hypothetical protein